MILTFFSANKYGIKSDMFASIQREWATLEKVFKAYTASLNGAKFSISDFNTALAQSKAKAEQEGEAVEGLTLKMVALRAGAMLLNVALNAIVSTVANFVITKFNEWRTAIETNAQKSKELSSSMTDLISQYKELGDKSGWDTDDFAQAKDLNAEILDLLKNQSAEMDKKLRKLDLENGKYQEQIDLLNELSISTLTQNKADQGKLLEQTAKGKSSGQYVVGDSSDTDMANALSGKFGGSLNSNTGVFNFGGFDSNDADSILAYYDKLSNALDYLGSNYDSATLEASSLYNQLKSEKNAIEDQANAYRSSSDTLKEVIAAQKLSSTSSKRSEEDIKAVTDALEGLKGAYGGITSGNLVSFLSGDKKLGGTYADALNQLKEVMLDLGFEDNTSDAQAFVDVLVQLGVVSSSSASKVDGLSESTSAAADQLKEATDGLDKIQSAYSTLSDVVDEYNENGYLTVSTLTDLINLGPEYYDCLVNESGQLAINTENINTMADAYYEMAKAALYAQAIESLNANTNTYANASKFLSQAQQEVKDMKSLLYTEGQRLIDEGGLSGDALATQVQAQQRIINTYSAMMDLLDKTHAQSADNQFRNPKDKNSNKSSNSEDKMTDAVSAWETLSAAMEEYNQYGNLCISTLNDLLGLEDDYTSLLTEQNGKMSINTTEFKNLMFAQIAQANATDESGKSAAELKRILQYVDENVKGNTISFEQLTDAIEGYGTAMDKAKEKTDAIKSAFSGLSEVMNNKTDRSNPFGLLDSDDVEKQHDALMQLAKDTDVFKSKAYNPETGEVDFNSKAFKDSVVEYLNGMADAAAQTGGAGAKAIEKNWRDAAKAIADGKISVEEFYNGLGYSLEKATKEIDDFQSGFSDITDIVDEYNLYGGLSIDNYQKLMALSPEYLSCLKLEGDQLVFNEAAYKQLLIDKLNEMIATYEQTDATKELAERLKELRDDLLNSKTGFKGAKDAAEEFKSAMSDLKEILSSVLSIFEKFNDKSNNDLKIWGDVMGDVIDKRIEDLKKQKDALEKNNDATERAIELAKAQDELARAEQQRTSRVYTENGYEWQADPEAVRTARQDLNDKQRQWNKEDAEKAIDDQIKKYNEFKDKLSEVMEDIGTSWDDYNKKLQYTAQIQEMTLGQMAGSLDGYHNKIIASLQNSGTISGIQTVISNLESLIGTLEKLNNVYNFLHTGTYTDGGFVGLVNTVKKVFGKNSSTSITKTITNSLDTITDATEVTFGGSGITGVINNSMTDGVKNAVINAQKELGSATTKNGLIGVFQNAWDAIGSGAKSLFSNSSSNSLTSIFSDGISNIGKIISNAFGGKGAGTSGGSGILGWFGNLLGIGGISLSSVPAMTATNTAGLTGLSKLMADGAIGAGAVGTGGSAAAATGLSSIPVVGAILAALGLGIAGAANNAKNIKNIWNSDDNTGTKIGKSVFTIGSTLLGPLMLIPSLIHDTIARKNSEKNGTSYKSLSEKIYEWPIWFWNWGKKTTSQLDDVSKNTKDTADDVKKKENKTNITVNAVQTTVNNGNETSGSSGSSSSSVSNGQQSFWDKLWGSKFWFWNWGKKAVGDKGVKHTGTYNVDEQGSELIVRQPQSGRYTYLETGDGVVPADITSRLFEMGGNPDKWFTDQMAKHSTATMVQSRNHGGISMTIGDVNVNNPVGDTDALARQIVQQLPNKMVQRLNKR